QDRGAGGDALERKTGDGEAAHGALVSESGGAEDTEARETRTPDEMYSCSALCGMHMVEICNKDKSLWNAHGSKWQPTPCGTRRDEDFLADCYRRQWLTGAFHDSCVVPCESTPEGRGRLLGILQTAGCLRLRSSRAHASAWTF